MTDDDNMFIGIKFLMGPARDVSHGDELGSSNFRKLEFPRFADVEQGEFCALILESLHFFRGDFMFHGLILYLLSSRGRGRPRRL